MKKILVVYNPKSSNYQAVEKEVLTQVRSLPSFLVGKYEVKPQKVRENAELLAKLLADGDLILAAGGDGTATMAANAIILSGKKATLAVLGYGNFNDMANVLGTLRRPVAEIVEAFEQGKVASIYPLEVKTNGKLWRYVPGYLTLGLFAESTEVFDAEKVRSKLQKGKRGKLFSWMTLAKWYFKNHRRRIFLPKFRLNGEVVSKKTTDYVAMNAPRMASVMKGKSFLADKKLFASATAELGNLMKLVNLMAKSILGKTPVYETKGDTLEFEAPGTVEFQSEGEYEKIKDVQKIEVRKTEKCLQVVKL